MVQCEIMKKIGDGLVVGKVQWNYSQQHLMARHWCRGCGHCLEHARRSVGGPVMHVGVNNARRWMDMLGLLQMWTEQRLLIYY